jgi:hypothetical protein
MAEAHIHAKGKVAIADLQALPWEAGTTVCPGRPAGRGTKGEPDCTITYPDGVVVPVEVKRTKTSVAQVRALEYRVIVVWREADGRYWVVPAHDLLVHVASFAGQHCQNPFECCNPGKPSKTWAKWECPRKDVPSRIRTAYEAGQQSPLKRLVPSMEADIRSLADKHRRLVLAGVPS